MNNESKCVKSDHKTKFISRKSSVKRKGVSNVPKNLFGIYNCRVCKRIATVQIIQDDFAGNSFIVYFSNYVGVIKLGDSKIRIKKFWVFNFRVKKFRT